MDIILSDSINCMSNGYQLNHLYSPIKESSKKVVKRKEESIVGESFINIDSDSCQEETTSLLDECPVLCKARIKFDSFLNIVLIPSRFEFKEANCDLWWKSSDYKFFQQSASR